MGTPPQAQARVTTGLLSEGEREFFRGEKDDIQDPEGYERNARYRARQRIEQIEEDLELLREAGEDDVVEDFYQTFGRVERLEKQVEDLRDQLEAERES